ncbi:MAG: DUF4838 domain-containing protein, partial [Kiritimatiellae bacterium]|nr:DUF4838 domain-containing protein [Kiritimatiellia bacterium]
AWEREDGNVYRYDFPIPRRLDPEAVKFTRHVAERVAKFADKEYRKKMSSFGSSPSPVELAWRGGPGDAASVKVFLGGECVFATNVATTSVRVYNLEIAREYSWSVSVGGETASAVFRTEDCAPRLLRVPSVKNCRDLGGRVGLLGCRVRQGRIFRTRAFNGDARQKTATNEQGRVEVVDIPGWKRIHAVDRELLTKFFGVKSDIDLRYDREVKGMTCSPLGPGVEWLHLPVNSYGGFGSAMSKESFAKIFRVCADPARHAVAFHCSAGQDRTGAVAFALCAILGVDEEELYRDWEATGFWNPSHNLRHETKFCKLLDLFRRYPGENWTERAEAYALSCGIARAEIERFRAVMLEGYGESSAVKAKTAPGFVIAHTPAAAFAAEELKAHLDLVTGEEWPLVSESEASAMCQPCVWHVGTAPDAAAGAALRPEEGRWRVTPQGAWFWGEGENGARFAVLEYCERELGARWPWGDSIHAKRIRRDALPVSAGATVPAVLIRTMRPRSKESICWHGRMRMGRHDAPKYGHAFTKYWERFGTTHPEFFAMRADGRRLPSDAAPDVMDAAAYRGKRGESISMCTSCDGLVVQVVEDWKSSGAPEYINICENDSEGKNVCHCPECSALDPPPPACAVEWWDCWHADRYVRFAGRVLAAARRVRPDAKTCFYAYNATQEPPRRFRLADGLVMGLVSTTFEWTTVTNYVAGWKRMGLGEFFWRPNRHHYYECPNVPIGCEEHFFRIWKHLDAEGCIGYDYSAPKYASRLEWFRDYVIMKGMQDPSKDFSWWEDRYMESFGAAADDVKAYFRYWREEVWNKRLEPDMALIAKKGRYLNFGRGIIWNLGDYFHPEDYDAAEAHLDRALARGGLAADDRSRVEELKLAHEHARLFYRAVVERKIKASSAASAAATRALRDFRMKHGFELVPWAEGYFGDVCGIKALLESEKGTVSTCK